MTGTGATWRNWARTEKVRPHRVERPSTAEAVQRAVLAAARTGTRVKPVGSGHSFSAIAVAPGVQLDLSDLAGVGRVDTALSQVTLAAGTRLSRIPALLAPYGLAMANLGDIDKQSISGAIATGTHGTGSGFGSLATQVVAATLVTGDGGMLVIDQQQNAELLPGVALGLGALGVIVDVTLQCVPEFVLEAEEKPEPLAGVLEGWANRTAAADHFEFYWFPHTDIAVTKTHTRHPAGTPAHPRTRARRFLDDEVLGNAAFGALCVTGRMLPALTPPLNRLAASRMGHGGFSDISTNVFTTPRRVRFREMEYGIPLTAVPEAFAEIQRLIERRRWQVSFPVEVRAAAADDLWMSTASGRSTGYIAVHRYRHENPAEYFAAVEEILTAFGGRPHWGKMHGRRAEDLADAYPRFGDFVALRDRLDPQRLFGNAYLTRVLGA